MGSNSGWTCAGRNPWGTFGFRSGNSTAWCSYRRRTWCVSCGISCGSSNIQIGSDLGRRRIYEQHDIEHWGKRLGAICAPAHTCTTPYYEHVHDFSTVRNSTRLPVHSEIFRFLSLVPYVLVQQEIGIRT
jgi:hypothetical protein